MISLATFRELYRYNYWARDRQLAACAHLTEEEFRRPMGNSFSSVRDTLVHLLQVEWIWLERWNLRAPKVWPSDAGLTGLAQVTERWKAVERGVWEFLGRANEQDLRREISYVNFQGQTWTYALWRMMMHVITHQSYHRGQVTTLLRQLGKEAPMVDYLLAIDMGLEPSQE
ncbi:MAG TPA: DinB family protein [Terriglobales bacterium]|nr:DinB family protein [Terriglobales bacterium]